DEGGWALLEETEAPLDAPGLAEARIAPPVDPAAPPDPPGDEGVEDARVVEEVGAPPEAPAPDAAEAPIDGPPTLADELDTLISQLEDAPRIRPDPTFQGPDVSFDEEIADDMVSETLARIYAAQRQYAEAAVVYEKLAQQRPEQADEIRRRAAEMRAQGAG